VTTPAAYLGQVYREKNCNGSCAPTTGAVVAAPDGADVTAIDFHLQPNGGQPPGKRRAVRR
jgi:hypothetical protein